MLSWGDFGCSVVCFPPSSCSQKKIYSWDTSDSLIEASLLGYDRTVAYHIYMLSITFTLIFLPSPFLLYTHTLYFILKLETTPCLISRGSQAYPLSHWRRLKNYQERKAKDLTWIIIFVAKTKITPPAEKQSLSMYRIVSSRLSQHINCFSLCSDQLFTSLLHSFSCPVSALSPFWMSKWQCVLWQI